MKTLIKLVVAASTVAAISANAQTITDIQARTPVSAYTQDGRGVIARNPFGLCWRTGYWTSADSDTVVGCDGAVEKVATPVAIPTPTPTPAPTPIAAPAPEPVAAPVVAAKPAAPTVKKITFAADAFFDFDKAILKQEAKSKLDDMASKLKGSTLEALIVVGHTDSFGTDEYNQRLSVKRADAVKAYLTNNGGIDTKKITASGKGEKQPVASNKTVKGRAQNRRIEIEVSATEIVK